MVALLGSLAVAWMVAAAAAAAPPAVEFAAGYNNSNCEAHPHAGVELADGAWLIVGDSVCWDGSLVAERVVFVVVAEREGAERWTRVLGDIGFNYGKYGTQIGDGTIVVAGVKSVVDAEAKERGFPYIEARTLWRLNATDGRVISETVFDNAGKLDGARDGFMCATPSRDDSMVVFATGFEGGDSGWDGTTYDEDPMFLIYGGTAFAAKLKFGDAAAAAAPETVFHAVLDSPDGYRPMQGMRIFHGFGNSRGRAVVSAASSTGPFDGRNYGFHFSAVSVDDGTGAVDWARIYRSGHASHPYALVLSKDGDVVIAGLAVPGTNDTALNPVGRLLKARAADGEAVFDARMEDRETRFYNIECYGVDTTAAGGYVVACGNGPEAPPDWMDCHQRTWTAFLYETDGDGAALWKTNLTDAAEECVNDAGEFVLRARDGGYAVYVDSGTLGRAGTGGNFGLVRLAPP